MVVLVQSRQSCRGLCDADERMNAMAHRPPFTPKSSLELSARCIVVLKELPLLHSRTRKVGVGYCRLCHKGQKEWANGSKVARFDKILGEIAMKLYTTKSLLIPTGSIHQCSKLLQKAPWTSENLILIILIFQESSSCPLTFQWGFRSVTEIGRKFWRRGGNAENRGRSKLSRFFFLFFCQKNEKAWEKWNFVRVTLSPGPGTQLQEAAKTTKHTSFLSQR